MTEDATGSALDDGVPDRLTRSECCRLLASERRRTVLAVLGGRTAPVDLRDLAREISVRGDDAMEAGTADRVAVTLHHNHLPRMDDLGLLDYDPGANRIESCPDAGDGPIEQRRFTRSR